MFCFDASAREERCAGFHSMLANLLTTTKLMDYNTMLMQYTSNLDVREGLPCRLPVDGSHRGGAICCDPDGHVGQTIKTAIVCEQCIEVQSFWTPIQILPVRAEIIPVRGPATKAPAPASTGSRLCNAKQLPKENIHLSKLYVMAGA